MDNSKLKKRVLIFNCIMLIFTFILNIGIKVQANDDEQTSVEVSPIKVKVGEIVDIPIMVSNVSNLYSGSVDLQYNSEMIEIIEFSKGTINEEDDYNVFVNRIENDNASFAFSLLGKKLGKSGSGTIANIKIKAKKEGIIDLNKLLTVKLINNEIKKIETINNIKGIEIWKEEYKAATIKSFSCNRVSGQPIYTPLTFTATSDSSDSTYYQFSIKFDGKWSIIKEYSKENTVQWMPIEAGTYIVRVMVKNEGADSSIKYDQYKDITFKVIDEDFSEELVINSYKANKVSGKPVGTNITFTAETNFPKTTLYEFAYKFEGKWITAQKYSNINSFNFIPTKAGTYLIRVYAKHPVSTNNYDCYKDITFKIIE